MIHIHVVEYVNKERDKNGSRAYRVLILDRMNCVALADYNIMVQYIVKLVLYSSN